jgi:hypothetical protein
MQSKGPPLAERRSQLATMLAEIQAELAAMDRQRAAAAEEESDDKDSQSDEVWPRCSMLWCSVASDTLCTLHTCSHCGRTQGMSLVDAEHLGEQGSPAWGKSIGHDKFGSIWQASCVRW